MLIAKTSGETAPALSRGEGLGGFLRSAARIRVERDDGKGKGQSGSSADLSVGLGLVSVLHSPELHALRRSL